MVRDESDVRLEHVRVAAVDEVREDEKRNGEMEAERRRRRANSVWSNGRKSV
jgi:hypothetical protein